MWGRKRSPVEQVADTLEDALDEVKRGALKGAAGGVLNLLGSKAADAVHNVTGNGDLGSNARKAQQGAGKTAAQVRDTAKKKAKDADVGGKAAAAGGLLQTLGSRVGGAAHDVQKNVGGNGLSINIDASDLPRLLRGGTLIATGLGTLFAPGSPLDASRHRGVDTGELADQTRQGIDSAADLTQQRIKDIVDLAKDALSSLSDALTSGIETAEGRAQKALEETEKSLTKATEQAAKQAKKSLPKQKRGGSLRWLFFGLLVGGGAAFASSPLAGPLGERITNLRRDLGLGGGEDDDSQYWPSPPPESSSDTGTTGGASSSDSTTNETSTSGETTGQA